MKAGERLGHYEILSSLGSGGMGEVFRARDVRLGREVAVKALSPALVRAPEALHRLEQERLNPNYANGHFWYAAGLASRGRIDEAIAEARRAVELDPVSPIVAAGLAWMYNFARDYDRAIAVIRPVLELNPRFPTLQSRLAVAYRHKELHELAIDHHRLAVDASGGSADMLAELAISLAAAGRTGEARRVLAQVSAMAERHYVSSYARATVHLALGERRTALDWLEKAADERAWYLPFIAVEPDVDRLRNEPRFEALLDRLHLPRR